MIDIYAEMIQLTQALEESGADYAICGGFAVAIHGYVRATKDIDLLIQVGDLEKIVTVAKTCGFDPCDGFLQFNLGTANETKMKRLNKFVGGDFLSLDLIFVNPSTAEAWQGRLVFQLPSHQIRVIAREGLLRMKQIAGRTQDLLDLEKLSQEV